MRRGGKVIQRDCRTEAAAWRPVEQPIGLPVNNPRPRIRPQARRSARPPVSASPRPPPYLNLALASALRAAAFHCCELVVTPATMSTLGTLAAAVLRRPVMVSRAAAAGAQ